MVRYAPVVIAVRRRLMRCPAQPWNGTSARLPGVLRLTVTGAPPGSNPPFAAAPSPPEPSPPEPPRPTRYQPPATTTSSAATAAGISHTGRRPRGPAGTPTIGP